MDESPSDIPTMPEHGKVYRIVDSPDRASYVGIIAEITSTGVIMIAGDGERYPESWNTNLTDATDEEIREFEQSGWMRDKQQNPHVTSIGQPSGKSETNSRIRAIYASRAARFRREILGESEEDEA